MKRHVIATVAALALTLVPMRVLASSSNGPAPTEAKQATTNPGSNVPSWSGSFTYGGTTYRFTMVGTDPARGSATTTVPVLLVPLRLTFSNGVVLDGADRIRTTLQSPIFQATDFPTGHTQYGDAVQRGSFWSTVASTSPDWHVLLGQPTVQGASIAVPQNQGAEFTGSTSGLPIGETSDQWLYKQESNLVNSMHVGPGTLTIFLTHNVFTYASQGCCIYGFHTVQGSTSQTKHSNTFIFAAYIDPGVWPDTAPSAEATYGSPASGIHGLSHEVSEWLNDPDISNTVPSWNVSSGLASLYGCTSLLEVGDPLVSTSFAVAMPNGTTYAVQDEALLSWFERTTPSSGFDGRYSYFGTFTAPSSSC